MAGLIDWGAINPPPPPGTPALVLEDDYRMKMAGF